MDYSRPLLAERLAAEYVLGTLRGPARRRFEALLPAHPGLRHQVQHWEQRLHVLAADIPPVAPRPVVWQRIQQRLFPSVAEPMRPWWQRLALWQGLATAATVAAISLGVLLQQPVPSQPPIVVVLQSTDPALQKASTGASAQFVASISGDGQSLVLKPIAGASVTAQQALELWALPSGGGAPRSLGLVSAQDSTTVLRKALLKGNDGFAISVEPPGGSPTGAPTGPVISVGKFRT